jgi:ribulose-phosphate 3-epimerase
MIEVLPAILPESFDEIAAKVAQVKGLASRVQIDVANGSYAPSKTWPYISGDHFERLLEESEGLPFWEEMDYEVDLLIAEPEKEIDKWIQVGVAAAVVHIESTEQFESIIKKLHEVNAEVGLGIKPSTPNDELYRYIDTVDFVQCMGNDNIGYHGVELDPVVYDKIRDIRAKYPDMPIAVDIGVNIETAPKLVEAGATKLISGSAIFGSENIKETIKRLRNS